ncbi:unnamed protein product [Caenorhabditis auriculariae]|uniref:hypoxia-inducible factor-proline dioxygenase n=1 Tax=Caenorhabditis auriculariae TaxID=2777116 RepID=A0A8S1GVF5_9PELO|nr:unnamed protein product [Caenorhabditis auriculariae]
MNVYDDSDQPSTSQAYTQLSQVCSYCGHGSLENRLMPCLFCGTVFYCSSEHQKSDWVRHKSLCQSLQFRKSNSVIMGQHVDPSPSSSVSSLPQLPTIPTFIAGELAQNMVALASFGTAKNAFTVTEFSAFRPYRDVVASSSSAGSVQAFNLPTMASAMPSTSDTMSSPALLSSLSTPSTSSSSSFSSTATAFSPVKTALQASPSAKELQPNKEVFIPTDDPDIQIIEGGLKGSLLKNRKRSTPSSADLKVPFKDHNKNVVYSTSLQEHQRLLQGKGLALNLHQAMVLRLRYIAEHAIRSLNEFGWAVVDNFLGSEHCKFTALEIEKLYERGLFSAGQLMEGRNKDEYHIKDIRSDQIYWYDGADKRASDAATVRLLISMVDSVIQHFKQRVSHDIGGRSRAMLAIYPGNGTRYVKHVDNPVKDGRCITTIYYCNENWDLKKDGGTLRLYPESSATPMDIDPRADRLVFFWSDRRNPHEVMPVFRHRFAITIWYMDRDERNKALVRNQVSKGAASSSKDLESLKDEALLAEKIRNDMVLASKKMQKEVSMEPESVRRSARLGIRSTTGTSGVGRASDRRSSGSSENEADESPGAPQTDPEYTI